jgi:hypothetical protein
MVTTTKVTGQDKRPNVGLLFYAMLFYIMPDRGGSALMLYPCGVFGLPGVEIR